MTKNHEKVDWNDAHRAGCSAKAAADAASSEMNGSISLAELGLDLMDQSFTDYEVHAEVGRIAKEMGIPIGDIPNVAGLREAWHDAGRTAHPRQPKYAAPDLSIIRRNRVAATPFPLDAFQIPGIQDWVRKTAASKSTPVDYVAGSLLAVAAGMLGPKRRVSPWLDWSEPAILWFFLVGEPSLYVKSPSFDPLREAIRQVERFENADLKDRIAKWEAEQRAALACCEAWEKSCNVLVRQWEDACAKAANENRKPPEKPELPAKPREAYPPEKPTEAFIWTSDTTPEKLATRLSKHVQGIICAKDELSALLGSFNRYGGSGGDQAFWLQVFGGRPDRYDRCKNGDQVIDIPFMAVSLIGGIQPDKLNTHLLEGDNDGFAARPLYAWPDPVRSQRPTEFPDHGALLAALQKLRSVKFQDGASYEPTPRIVKLSPEAIDVFQPWWEHKQWNAKLFAGDKIAGAIGKLDGVALRIAMVLEFLKWAWPGSNQPEEPTEVSLSSMQNALKIIDEWARHHLERVFAEAVEPQANRDARVVARWLLQHRPKTVNARELTRTPGFPIKKDKTKDLNDAIKLLVELHWLTRIESGAPNRPRGDYEVNPAVYEAQP